MAGALYLVGSPIGNLEDITLRAQRVLREADVIAAEDTRVARTLLARYEISTPLISFHEHSSSRRVKQVLELLHEGKQVAVVSDAGMPGISDPGADLVAACVAADLPVSVIPGPTAVETALAYSGFLAQEFVFLGFLPSRSGPRRQALARAAGLPGAIVCFEAPHRVVEMLRDAQETLGDRPAICARELTKLFEEIARGTLSELLAHFTAQAPRGEFTVVISGAAVAEETPDLASGLAEVQELVTAGLSPSRAVAHVAKWRNLPRRELYQMVLANARDPETHP